MPRRPASRPVLDDAAAAAAGRARRRGSRTTSARRRTSSGRAPAASSGSSSPGRSPRCREPAADPPTDWPVPDPTALYFRASIVEQLPDPLTPLFADLDRRLASTRSLHALFERAPRAATCVRAGDVGLPTINGYAYYRYTPRGYGADHAAQRCPRHFAARHGDGRVGGRRPLAETVSHPRYPASSTAGRRGPWPSCRPPSCWTASVELLDAGTEYYTAVQTIIPLAATSEIVFTAVLRPAGPPRRRPAGARRSCSGSTASRSGRRSRCTTWPRWARDQPGLADALLGHVVDRRGRAAAGAGRLRRRPRRRRGRSARAVRSPPRRYGHAVYNLDFANPVPADDPAPLLDMVRLYLGGGGRRPVRAAAARLHAARGAATRGARAGWTRCVRAPSTRLLRWAQAHRPDPRGRAGRRGPGLAAAAPDAARAGRRLVAARGARPARRRVLAAPARSRPPSAIVRGSAGRSSSERQRLWRGQRRATPPQLLPGHLDGSAVRRDDAGDHGRADRRRADRHRRQRRAGHRDGPGAGRARRTSARCSPATSWSPASPPRPGPPCSPWRRAVVTDIGGPLSHSSIVAREYGIPAVLGTAVATRRIADGAACPWTATPEPSPCSITSTVRRASPIGTRIAGQGRTTAAASPGQPWWVRQCWSPRRAAGGAGPGSARVDPVCVDQHGGAPLLDHDPVVGRPVVVGAAGGGEDVPQQLPSPSSSTPG